jgi:hypothetical protein
LDLTRFDDVATRWSIMRFFKGFDPAAGHEYNNCLKLPSRKGRRFVFQAPETGPRHTAGRHLSGGMGARL